jgi:hypothetical protein
MDARKVQGKNGTLSPKFQGASVALGSAGCLNIPIAPVSATDVLILPAFPKEDSGPSL